MPAGGRGRERVRAGLAGLDGLAPEPVAAVSIQSLSGTSRRRHVAEMTRQPCLSDASDEERAFVVPCLALLPPGAAQRRHDLRDEKPPGTRVAPTGRDAHKIPELADLATGRERLKHPFRSGVRAQAGVEF